MAMFSGPAARGRSLWRGLRRRADVEAEMSEEFRLHQELRAEDLVRSGLSPAEAARRARLEFGSAEMHKDAARESRGLRPFDELRVSWLDVKLGVRMLGKYPGITLVGGLAMAFAIWVGSATFEMATQVIRPTLPLPDGDRIVALRNRDVAKNRPDGQALHDFVAWREQLASVRDLGAYRTLGRNLIVAGGDGEPVEVAEISAAGFRVARVPAIVGRPLVEADERAGAPPVVVLGYDVWRTRFAADPDVVGRSVRLGHTVHTVVGVMPEGFAFPVAHNLWVPLRLNPLDHGRRQGPAIQMFGRLADGVTLREARAELTTIGRRATAEFRDTHEHLRPEIMPYARSIVDLSGLASVAVMSINLPLVMLLVLVCGNVALLMFARAATREAEITVRNALGASRGRIVAQLFAEALVLGVVAAAIGLAAAGFGLRWVMDVVEAEMLEGRKLPFWFQNTLSPTTLLYAAALTVLGAVIAGVVPALKVTHGLGARLKQATAGGGGLRFGGVWTAVIVAQVAVTVAFPVTAFLTRRDAAQIEAVDVGFPADEYLSVRLEMDREPPPSAPGSPPRANAPSATATLRGNSATGERGDTSDAAFRARFRASYEELERRLMAEPAVVGVTYGDRLPRMYHPYRLIEVDEGGVAPLNPNWPAYRVSSASVDPDFFAVVGTPILAGRRFQSADVGSDHGIADARGARNEAAGAARAGSARGGAVIVNQSFVKLVLGGRNPIGRRLRYVHYEEWSSARPLEPGPWYEIVGVVRDMGMAVGADVGQAAGGDPKVAGFYHPVGPGGAYPARVAVHVRGDPTSFAPRLRAIATEADPRLRLYDLTSLDQVNKSELQFLSFWFRILLMVSAIALTLSLAGIYAVMSFTVARRTREIGIRVALGAGRGRVVAAIFRRPLAQVALGVVAGGGLVTFMAFAMTGGNPTPKHAAMVVGYSALMLAVCMLACIVPTRRALRVEPTEALRADA